RAQAAPGDGSLEPVVSGPSPPSNPPRERRAVDSSISRFAESGGLQSRLCWPCLPPTLPSPARGEGTKLSLPPCGGELGWGLSRRLCNPPVCRVPGVERSEPPGLEADRCWGLASLRSARPQAPGVTLLSPQQGIPNGSLNPGCAPAPAARAWAGRGGRR